MNEDKNEDYLDNQLGPASFGAPIIYQPDGNDKLRYEIYKLLDLNLSEELTKLAITELIKKI